MPLPHQKSGTAELSRLALMSLQGQGESEPLGSCSVQPRATLTWTAGAASCWLTHRRVSNWNPETLAGRLPVSWLLLRILQRADADSQRYQLVCTDVGQGRVSGPPSPLTVRTAPGVRRGWSMRRAGCHSASWRSCACMTKAKRQPLHQLCVAPQAPPLHTHSLTKKGKAPSAPHCSGRVPENRLWSRFLQGANRGSWQVAVGLSFATGGTLFASSLAQCALTAHSGF